MENSSTTNELLWAEQQRADKAHADTEHREWVRDFALMIALVLLALTVAALLANLQAAGTIRS